MSMAIEGTSESGLVVRVLAALAGLRRGRPGERAESAREIDPRTRSRCNHDYPYELTEATIERQMWRAYLPGFPYGG